MAHPVATILVALTIAAGALGLYFFVGNLAIRGNELPAIGVSGITPTETGCTAGSPTVTLQVEMSNVGFANGVAHLSFYQDGAFLGSHAFTVPARERSFQDSASFPIASCGAHTYTYQLDAVTGP